MYTECVIACVDFGDFLATTLPWNREAFDRMVIVTSPEDEETKKVARQYNCVVVESIRYREKQTFNKGKLLNDGIKVCVGKGWLCLLDSDIILPKGFRKDFVSALASHKWWKSTLFGFHRYMCNSYEDWKHFVDRGHHHWTLEKKRRPTQKPAGYLQMWYQHGMAMTYPENYPEEPDPYGGFHGDLAFASKFAHCRHLDYPLVIHLETRAHYSTDRKGRKSPKWGPA